MQGTGKQHLEACAQTDPGPVAGTLHQLAKAGQQHDSCCCTSEVQLSCLTSDMLNNTLECVCSSVSKEQLEVYDHFTEQFGRRGS